MKSKNSGSGNGIKPSIFMLAAFVLYSLLLNGCVSQPQVDNSATAWQINIKDPDRVRFQGKGAGAGVMMMSSMGPMGIAIGVAIDEGIGKDIEENLQQTNFGFEQSLRSALSQAARGSREALAASSLIEVKRYGYRSSAGENDPTSAHIILSVKPLAPREGSTQEGEVKNTTFELEFPADFEANMQHAPTEQSERGDAGSSGKQVTSNNQAHPPIAKQPLEQVKKNPEVARALMLDALEQLSKKIVALIDGGRAE